MRKHLLVLLLWVAAMPAAMYAAATSGQTTAKAPSQKNLRIRGLMTYDNLKDVTNYGIYDYTATAPIARQQKVSIPRISASGGSVVKGNVLYYYDYAVEYGYVSSATYYKYDLATQQQVTRQSVGYDTDKAYNNAAMSVATDPTTGVVYCCNFQYDNTTKVLSYALSTWDLEGMSKTVVAPLSVPLRVLACTADGQLYGITASTAATGSDNNGGMLVKVDKQTGAVTKVGDTGVRPGAYFQAATIDAATGTFYWFANEQDEAANLYTIDLATGAATKIGALPEGDQVVCAYVPVEYADGVPSPAEDIALTFEGGALSGQLSFKVPADTYSGATLEGDVTYTLTAGDKTLATGSAKAASTVSVPVTVEADGTYDFTLTLANTEGKSPATSITRYVGYDTPEAVTDVKFSRKGSTNTVTWTAPAKGVNGGYIDAQTLTYRVTRMPDGKVATAQGTSFSEDFDTEELGSYYYKVEAVNGTHTGAAASSNQVNIGQAIVPPYVNNFSDTSTFGLFTVIDANGDGSTWKAGSTNVAYRYNMRNDADDWLIMPPLKLQAGKSYTFSYKTWVMSSRSEERMEVRMGQAATAEAMTTTLKEVTSYTNPRQTPITETIEIMPEQDGIYYIGFHAVSLKNKGTLNLDDISVAAGKSTAVPAAATDLAVTPADRGTLGATISFTAPSQTAMGQALTGDMTYTLTRGTTPIATATAVTAGQKVSIADDAIATRGNYTYTLTFANANGEGKSVSTSAYIGPDTPLSPSKVHVTDLGDGTATISWTPTGSQGANGGYVDVDATQYDVTNQNGITIAQNVKGTQATVSGIDISGAQAIAYFKVRAHNDLGKATAATTSDTIITGKAYALPFEETFDNAAYSTSLWTTATLAGKSYNGKWSPREDADLESDGGYAAYTGYDTSKARLQTPKLSVEGIAEATLSFSYSMLSGIGKLAVEVSADNGDWQHVADVESTDKWTTRTLNIGGLASARSIRIGFVAETVGTQSYIYVDNLKLTSATTGIGLPQTGETISVEPGGVSASNDSQSLIQVCTTAGQVVAQARGALHCTGLAAGVYVVRNGHTARTIVIR